MKIFIVLCKSPLNGRKVAVCRFLISFLVPELLMYQSIPSLTTPPPPSGRHSGIRKFSLSQVFAQLSLPGGRGFDLEKFPGDLYGKLRNFSICFKETCCSLKSRCFCAVSYQFLQKTVVVYTLFFYKKLRSASFVPL